MIVKEKLIFWTLLIIFIGILGFGFFSQGNRKQATKGLLQDIELAAKKSIAKNKPALSGRRAFDRIMAMDTMNGYKTLLKRSPFFRPGSKPKAMPVEPVVIEEGPKEPILKYKGKVVMGSKIMVVIEDQGTGKSYFVKEGDMVGDFVVLRLDEDEVALKKKGGEEIVLTAAKKKEEKEKKAEDVKK